MPSASSQICISLSSPDARSVHTTSSLYNRPLLLPSFLVRPLLSSPHRTDRPPRPSLPTTANTSPAMPASSSSSRNQFAQHVRVSSTEDLSYNIPTGTGGTKDVIQTIVTGRKCWKTMKGKGEVVWPPHLEAALVEGERFL